MSIVHRMHWKKQMEDKAHKAYLNLVSQARLPVFFECHEVPDTLDGRFELLALHMVLVLRRLKDVAPSDPLFGQVRYFGQALYDTMFRDIDLSLREMGVGDMGIGRRVKQMVRALHGRLEAYVIPEQWDGGAERSLEAALSRNLYGTCTPSPQSLAAMVTYVKDAWQALSAQETVEVLEGKFLRSL